MDLKKNGSLGANRKDKHSIRVPNEEDSMSRSIIWLYFKTDGYCDPRSQPFTRRRKESSTHSPGVIKPDTPKAK